MAEWVAAVWKLITGVAGIARTVLAFLKLGQAGQHGTRPMVRVVQMFPLEILIFGGGATPPRPRKMLLDYVKLKNVGGGPALAVKMLNPVTSALMLEVDVVEPLGDGPNEARRLGAVEGRLLTSMELSRDYALYYQDAGGHWHLTSFTPRPGKIDCSFRGPLKDSDVPPEVRERAAVTRA